MWKQSFTCSLLILGALVSPAIPAWSADPTVFVDSVTTGSILTLPNLNASEKFPVIVALPGHHMAAQLDRANWVFSAKRNGFALVDLEMDYDAAVRNAGDLVALKKRIDDTLTSLREAGRPLDLECVFLAGTSRGGMTAIQLALRYPGVYKAVGVACGASIKHGSPDLLSGAKGQKFFLLHGAKDTVVPIDQFEETKTKLTENGADVTSVVLPDSPHIINTSFYRKIVDWMAALDKEK